MTGCHLCIGSNSTSDNAGACPNMTMAVERNRYFNFDLDSEGIQKKKKRSQMGNI